MPTLNGYVGAIQRLDFPECPEQPIVYNWPSPHNAEVTSAVVVERWPGCAETYCLYHGCDDESPENFDDLHDALDALWRECAPPFCRECCDAGCAFCAKNN